MKTEVLTQEVPFEQKKTSQTSKRLNLDEIIELEAVGPKGIRKRVIQLAAPSLTEMILINFVQMLNMIMVSRVGPEAIAAVGLTNQPLFFSFAVFTALNVGTTAIIARSIGAGEFNDANRAAQQTFLLNIILSLVVLYLGYSYARPILIWMGAAPEVLIHGVAYTRIIFLSLGFTTMSMCLSAVLRGAGDTRTPMKINVLSNILVVVLGFPLIYGLFGLPKLGLVGAGIATMVARITASLWVMGVLFSGKFTIKLSVRKIWIMDRVLISRIVKIGLPSAGEQFAMQGGQIIFTKIVAGLGTVTYAATQVAFNVMGLTFMPGMAFAMVATTLVGQALGAGHPELAERFGWETSKFGMMLGGTVGLVFILFAPYIMIPYTNDHAVLQQGAIALRVVGIVQIAQAAQFILAGALRGAGDTKFPLLATFIGVWGFRVALCLLFVGVFKWGILGAWIGIAVDQFVRSLFIFYRFRSGKWKTIKI
ncbi:MAG: efflux family protein [Bacilli bacterium]|nr:efflux family protein [Bacilli bacterium]